MTTYRALPADALEALQELARISVGRPYLGAHALLCQRGLIDIKAGRFGAYARITEEGREYLSRTESRASRAGPQPSGPVGKRGVLNPSLEAATGAAAEAPSVSRYSLRGAEPRNSRASAKQANRRPTTG